MWSDPSTPSPMIRLQWGWEGGTVTMDATIGGTSYEDENAEE